MNIDEKTLRKLVESALLRILSENTCSKKDLYVIWTKDNEEAYLDFFRQAKGQKDYNIINVIDDISCTDGIVEKLKCSIQDIGSYVLKADIDCEKLSDFITVFPAASRDIIAKAALCICDTFETQWIENCLSNGEQIIFKTSGLKRFTGKETPEYIKRILSYYRDLMSFGAKITNDIFDNAAEIKELKAAETLEISKPKRQEFTHTKGGKKLITAADITTDSRDEIMINKGDIVTALARDKAEKLGKKIVYC